MSLSMMQFPSMNLRRMMSMSFMDSLSFLLLHPTHSRTMRLISCIPLRSFHEFIKDMFFEVKVMIVKGSEIFRGFLIYQAFSIFESTSLHTNLFFHFLFAFTFMPQISLYPLYIYCRRHHHLFFFLYFSRELSSFSSS